MPVGAVAVEVDAGAAKAAQPVQDPGTPDGRVPQNHAVDSTTIPSSKHQIPVPFHYSEDE